jgi:cytoskeleton protein RodZ
MMDSDDLQQPNAPKVSGPGERLRAARQRNGMEIKWVAGQLHIREWMVEAMEADEFDRITPPVFLKGYLTNYARFIGEPVDEILAMYKQCCGEETVSRKEPATVTFEYSPIDIDHSTMKYAVWGIAGVVLLVFTVLGITKLTGYWEKDLNGVMDRMIASIPSSEGEDVKYPVPVQPEQEPGNVENVVDKGATMEEGSPVLKKKGFFIEMVGKTWVDIRDSTGEFKLLGEMNKGERHQLGGKPPYNVLFGRGDAVKLYVDGKPYDLSVYQKGSVARFTFDPREQQTPSTP